MDLSLQVGGVVVVVCKVIVVWGSYSCHGHIRTVYQKYEDSHQTDHCAHQAETDNPVAAKVQLLYNEATQEGASSTSWYHHITWNEKMELKQLSVQTRFQKSWDTLQIVNKKGMQ